MIDPDKLAVTIRVSDRWQQGVRQFRAMNAAEETAVMDTLPAMLDGLAAGAALLEENARLRAEIAAFNLRTTDYMNV